MVKGVRSKNAADGIASARRPAVTRSLLQVLCVTSLVTATLVGLSSSVDAATGSPSVVLTMYSMPGDYIGGGTPQEFDPLNATFSGTLSTTGISLNVSGGTSGTGWTVVIDPPPGASFSTGYYTGVQRAEFRTSGHPGLDIWGDGRGCNTDTGAFEVRDLATTGSSITRLDLLYEQHCEGAVPALFGELRVGEPLGGPLVVSTSSITWPQVGLGGTGTPVPIYLRNGKSKAVSVGNVTLSGPSSSQFSTIDDTCSGTTLSPGGACDFFVGFTGSTHGPVTAAATIPIQGKSWHVQLDGSTFPGKTSLAMTSQPGDYIGQGETYKFTAATTPMSLSGSPSGLAADIAGWTVDLFPASGTILAPGKYSDATRYPFNGSGNGLSVYGDGRGCNTLTGSFTVKEVTFSPADNSVKNLKATFVQHCEGAKPALTGTLDYDYSPVTSPPPGVSKLTASQAQNGLSITWVNPSDASYSYSVIRIESGAPIGESPLAGQAIYQGTGSSATISGLEAGAPYTVSAFAVDKYGNVSAPVNQAVTG